MYNHVNCREVDNPKICAIRREDKLCLRKLPNTKKNDKNK
jgi:hypothetical protein